MTTPLKLLTIFGTRPEAIKMAPVVLALRQVAELSVTVCVTAQHRSMLDQALDLFGIVPDHDLDLMRPNQSLNTLATAALSGLDPLLEQLKPDWVIVHGDTTTCFAAALAAFHRRVRIAHVEAGLRTYDIGAPWPEEANRQLTGRLASLHFAPTKASRANLIAEGVEDSSIVVTGNTVIDALLDVSARIDADAGLQSQLRGRFRFLENGRKLVLVTGHRRENFGEGMRDICRALRELAEDRRLHIAYPIHLNPNVQQPVREILGNVEHVSLLDPLDYLPFIFLMKQSHIVLTDSGGIQEEAPSLGKPVLVMRETTERPEAVEAGTVRLVGSHADRIVEEVRRLIDDESAYNAMAFAHNPYGDGLAARRIALCFQSLARDRQL
jgi:UDP-N-acetylglucosamine 2-epimerase